MAAEPDPEKVSEFFGLLKKSLEERADAVPANLKFLERGQEKLRCEQIGVEDGYMNYIYRISEVEAEKAESRQSVVVKWSRATPRFADADNVEFTAADHEEVSEIRNVGRNTRECKAVLAVAGVLPGSTADIYWMDEHRYFFIMQDLERHATWRNLMDHGRIETGMFQNIARRLANLHRLTHRKTVGAEGGKKHILEEFTHPSIIKDMARVMFELAFTTDSGLALLKANRKFSKAIDAILPEIMDNKEIKDALSILKKAFLEGLDCVLHNDTHPGSFMVNPDAADGDIRMIDLEFSCIGNPCKEVGYTLAEVVMFYYVHQGRGNTDLCQKITDAVRAFIAAYLEMMGELISDKKFLQHVAGFMGHFAGLRLVGIAIDFKPFEGLEAAEARCLRAAIRLMKELGSVTTVDSLIKLAFRSA